MYQLKYILLFPLLLISYWCAAQVYPVHGTVILTPPYSVYLPDYAAEGQLRLLLQQRDLSQASYLLTIRMDLKLNGRSIMRTSPNYRPAPFSIAPGNPVALTGTDLLPYLDARNIDFSGYSRSEYERTKSLPEGSYTLCFTAYDYRRPEVAVSSATCGFYYLAKAEPPLINLPQCGTLIPSQGAMSVLFQWMPRNTSSLNSAMNTTYRFELFEVRPEGANPKAVVANSRPIFTEDIDQTQFFYNSTHPYLTHGMQYAWRVQAIDRSGRDAFRNKGYSEVCYFTFGGSPHTIDPLQKAPQGLQAKALTSQRGGAFWNKGNFDSYRFYFRKVGPNYEWFPREVRDTSLVFGELVPQIEYECRVQGKRGEFYGPYSDIVRFVTPEKQAPVACLDTTDYSKRPKGDPLATLAVGDKVDTHGFLLKINTLQSLGGGWYKGTGLITIPFLNNIGVKVFFDRMYVNTLYQNTDGEIKAVSRPRNQWVKDKLGSQGIVTKGTIKTDTQPDFTVNLQGAPPVIRDGQGQVINAQNPPKINENGIAEGPFTISVLDDKGSVKEVKVDQLPATLRDASGAVYQVNTDGKVTKVGQELAPEEQFTEEQLTNAISFGDGRVQFRQADGYALDTMKNMYNEKKVFHQVFTELGYEYITRWGGATRTVFDEFKAMEAGKPARVTAVFKLTNLTTGRRRPDMLRFVTGHNVRLFPIDSVVHHISEKTALISYTLEIPAGEEKDGLNIYAMLRTHPDKAHCIGKLTALSYRPQHLEVVMVYVGKTANKINLTDIQAKLDKIYNPIGVYIKVKDDRNFNPDPKWDINSDNKLNVLGSGAFSTLTPEMKALNTAYRATPQYNSNQAVLFVLEKSDSANIAGDMPRGEQFGYIFAEALKNVDVGWLVAHELGHGLFTLQHSWKNNGESSEGKTDNLMDYNKGTSLSKYQWDLIHNPENVWDWLKRDQESMYNAKVHLFLTPTGQVVDKVYADGEPLGLLVGNKDYTINSLKHHGAVYTWNEKSYTHLGKSLHCVMDDDKSANQVNVYRQAGGNCDYEYVVINWTKEDEQLNDSIKVRARIETLIKGQLWHTAGLRNQDPACQVSFLDQIKQKNTQCSDTEIAADDAKLNTLRSNFPSSSISQISNKDWVQFLSTACLQSLRKLTYAEITVLFEWIGGQPSIGEEAEVALLRLMNALSSDDYPHFIKLLSGKPALQRNLINEMDDVSIWFMADGNNYTNFVGALVKMFTLNPSSYEKDLPAIDKSNLLGQIVYLKPLKFEDKSIRHVGKYSKANGTVEIHTEKLVEGKDVEHGVIMGSNFTWVDVGKREVNPLDPILLSTPSKPLPLIKTALEGSDMGGNLHLVPAIFLKFAADKAFNQDALDATLLTLDVLSIAASGGVALSTKAHWAYRLWALSEMAADVAAIAVDYNSNAFDTEMSEAIKAFNTARNIIGIGQIANSTKHAVQYLTDLPTGTRNLLRSSESLSPSLLDNYVLWRQHIVGAQKTEAHLKIIDQQKMAWAQMGFSESRFPNLKSNYGSLKDTERTKYIQDLLRDAPQPNRPDKDKEEEEDSNECPHCKALNPDKVFCAQLTLLVKNSGNKSAVEKLCKEIKNRAVLQLVVSRLLLYEASVQKAFLEDISGTNTDANYLCANVSGIDVGIVEAWKLLRDARCVDISDCAALMPKDWAVLQQVKSIRSDHAILSELDGDTGLTEYIKANQRAKCVTCGDGGVTYIQTMVEFLRDLSYFATHYVDATRRDEVKNLLKRPDFKTREAEYYIIEVIRKYPLEFNDISDFEYDKLKECRPDVVNARKYCEFKSWSNTQGSVDKDDPQASASGSFYFFKTNLGSNSFAQFKGMLKAVSNLNQMAYYFDAKKLAGSDDSIKTVWVKIQFKELLYNSSTQQLTPQGEQVFEVIWNNVGLRENLFVRNAPKEEAKKQFLNTIVPKTSNSFYSFINVR